MYRQLAKLLYQFEPEWVHQRTMNLGQGVSNAASLISLVEFLFGFEDSRLTTEVGSLEFPNPIGLAAGFDKDGLAVPLLFALGFGAVEVGTLTPKAQAGNPKPRLFRLLEDQAIINRMGFNNDGIDAFVRHASTLQCKYPLGVNLGKNKLTENDKAADDYCIGLERSYAVGDYFTINISSPNTAGLRDLQSETSLLPLLKKILATRDQLSGQTGKKKPLWLKVAPDLTDDQLEVICQIALELKIDALVLTNTTLDRGNISDLNASQAGGLSGKPLLSRSNAILSKAFEYTSGKLPLVGVGGVFTAEDAWKKLELGASFVQIYTSLIYQGPSVVKSINKGLVKQLNQNRAITLPKRVVQ